MIKKVDHLVIIVLCLPSNLKKNPIKTKNNLNYINLNIKNAYN